MDWLSNAWDEIKGIAREYVDYENFHSELEAETQVQLAEHQAAVQSEPLPPPAPSFMQQIQPYLPWIAVGGVALIFGPRLLKSL